MSVTTCTETQTHSKALYRCCACFHDGKDALNADADADAGDIRAREHANQAVVASTSRHGANVGVTLRATCKQWWGEGLVKGAASKLATTAASTQQQQCVPVMTAS